MAPETRAQTATVTIDFDDQPGGLPPSPAVTTGMFSPFATFSTIAGSKLLIFSAADAVGGSPPNVLTAAADVVLGPFDSDVFVDFTHPVQDLHFKVSSGNDVGNIGSVNVFVDGSLASTLGIIGTGEFTVPIPIDLTSFTNVTRVEIVNITDEFGLSYDDFVFTAPVPEPATAAMLAVGLMIILGLASRRT
ncbi:MAG: PEP-CTERM sorting domain-containing protein [Betaproteobacteria bacterium]